MQINQEIATLLGKIALSGLWAGNIRLSEEIFRNLIALREGQSGPILGLAMCYAHRGHYDMGIEILEKQAFPRFESDPHNQAWYGLMLCLNKNVARGRVVLEALLADEETPQDVKNIAKEALISIA